jgi:hypothetical protein
MDCYTEPAPRGKRCTRCLCCDAVIVFAGEALCAACDDGTHPALPEQPRVSPALEDAFVAMGTSLGASEIRLCPSPANPENRAEAMTVRVRESNNHLTLKIRTGLSPEENTMKLAKPEIEEAIRKAGTEEPAGDVAERLKIDLGTVYYFRAKIRKTAHESGAKPAPPARSNKAERAIQGNAAERAAAAVSSWPVTLNVSVETMDKWFDALTTEAKAAIFTLHYQFKVEGFVDCELRTEN